MFFNLPVGKEGEEVDVEELEGDHPHSFELASGLVYSFIMVFLLSLVLG